MRNILTTWFLSLSILSFAQDGVVDANFGSAGFTTITPPSGPVFNDINKIYTLADGTILQCFSTFNSATGDNDFALARFDMDGQLDISFDGDAGNADGIVLTDFGGDDVATALTVQSDGKIVVVGYRIQAGTRVFAIARYNSDGTLDASFDGNGGNGDGKFITTIGSDDAAYAVAVSGSRIVATGVATSGINMVFAVVAYNISNGVLDTGFDTDGKATVTFGGFVETAYAVRIQTDSKIVVAGYSFSAVSMFAVARLNANGSLDTGFSGDGRVTTMVGDGGNDVAYDLVIHNSTGKILVAGSSLMNATGNDFAMVLYKSDGSLDTYLGGDGMVTLDLMGGDDVAHSVLLQTNFDILLGGYAFNGTDYDFAVAKFFSDGTINPNFNSAASAPSFPGVNIIDFTGNDNGYGISFQNANVIFGGINGVSIALTRLINTGQALPVSLLSFTASRQSASVRLQWETVREENSWYFELQRSADGKSFSRLADIPATGSASEVGRYMYNDMHPLPAANFYRLKIIDNDGSFKYSEVLVVKMDSRLTLTAFPNPVRDRLNVQLAALPGNMKLELVDAMGRLMKTIQLEGNGSSMSSAIDMSGLPKGLYFLKAGEHIVKLIKD